METKRVSTFIRIIAGMIGVGGIAIYINKFIQAQVNLSFSTILAILGCIYAIWVAFTGKSHVR